MCVRVSDKLQYVIFVPHRYQTMVILFSQLLDRSVSLYSHFKNDIINVMDAMIHSNVIPQLSFDTNIYIWRPLLQTDNINKLMTLFYTKCLLFS